LLLISRIVRSNRDSFKKKDNKNHNESVLIFINNPISTDDGGASFHSGEAISSDRVESFSDERQSHALR